MATDHNFRIKNGLTVGSVEVIDSSGKLTANAFGTNSNEKIEDVVADMITGATHSNITVTYDDTNGTLAFAAAAQYGDSDVESYLDTNGLTLPDNIKANFGADDDLEIYHSSSDGHSYIHHTKAAVTGFPSVPSDLILKGNNIRIVNEDGDNLLTATSASTGGTKLYHEGSQVLNTTSSGARVSGDLVVTGTIDANEVSLDNSEYIYLGTNDTMYLMTNGSQSYVHSGDELLIRSNNLKLTNTGSNEYFTGVSGGAATIYYNDSAKLATTSTGISVTGAITSTGAISGTSLDTGQGANELYAMNQNVRTTDSVTFATVNTGQGANELYAMNQNVRTTDGPTFASLTLNGNLDFNGNNIIDVNQINATGDTGWLDFNMDADNVYPQASTDNQTVLGSITHMNFVGDSNGNGTGGIFYWGYGVNKNDSGTFTQTMALDRSGNLTLSGTVDGRDIATDGTKLDTIATNADVTPSWVPSSDPSYATQTYVGNQISNLVDSAPTTLDTLNELAAALGDDANFSTTVTNSIAGKLSLTGGTLSGNLAFSDDGEGISFYGGEAIKKTSGTGIVITALSTRSLDTLLQIDRGSTRYGVYHEGYHPEADALTTAVNIGGVSFDGSASINLPGVNTAGNQNTSGTAAGLSGTPNITVGTISSSTIDSSGRIKATNWIELESSGAANTTEEAGIRFDYNDSPLWYFYKDNANDAALHIQSAGASGEGDATPRVRFARTSRETYFGGSVGINQYSITSGNSLDVNGNARINGDLDLEGILDATRDNGNVAAPSTSDHSAGTRIKLYDSSATAYYAIGIESNNMWFNSDGGFKFYRDGDLRFQSHQDGYFQINSHSNSWDGGLRMISQDGTDTFQIHPDNNGYMYVDKNWYFTGDIHVGSIGQKVWHQGNDGPSSGLSAQYLGGYELGTIDHAESFKLWTGINADATQAKRRVIARLYGCPGHWSSNWHNIEFTVTAEYYESAYMKYRLMGNYGNGSSGMLSLQVTEASGPFTSNFKLSLGSPVDAGWDAGGQDVFYQDLYADAMSYGQYRIHAKTYGHDFQTSNPTSGSGITVFYDSPAVSNISNFSDIHGSTYVKDNKIWNAGNDGPNSGLDADLLDGSEGSYYLNYNNFTNTPTIPSAVTNYITNDADDTMVGNLTIDKGTSTTLSVKCDNGGNALVRAGGDGQGTGIFEVTQDNGSHGGGMSYNGDGSPAWASGETADHVTFYRIESGTRTEVFHYPYNSNTVNFNSVPTVGGSLMMTAANIGSYAASWKYAFASNNGTNNGGNVTAGSTQDGIYFNGTNGITTSASGSTLTLSGANLLRSDVSDNYAGRTLSFGVPGQGTTTTACFASIEGNTDSSGEGSGRLFFREHNSTTGSMDAYGMSLGYRGGSTSVTTAGGNTWTGLSSIGNGEWGMWGHNGDNTGALIMAGDRAATYVSFAGNNLNNCGNITLASSKKIFFNNSSNYGIGAGGHNYNSGYFDTVESGSSTDPLELVYYQGPGVNIGSGGGSKYLNASTLGATSATTPSSPGTAGYYSAKGLQFGATNSGYETNSAQISAGQHQSNSLNFVGMGTASSNRRMDFWVEGSAYFRGNIVATGNVTAYGSASDKRLKKDIIKIDNAIDKIKSVSGYEFTWNENAPEDKQDKREFGVIAQEVEEAGLDKLVFEYTRPVSGTDEETKDLPDEKWKAVHYDKFVPILIEAVKEQQEQIEELKSIINTLMESK